MKHFSLIFLLALFLSHSVFCQMNLLERVAHHYADNDGVKIHYVTLGEGPVVLFLHGFPDYWFTWRDQLAALSPDYKAVAMDLRGYNKSDHPEGVENYLFSKLISDVDAVVTNLQAESVYLVGHDWGAAISWRYAMQYPDKVEKLVIMNVPHPQAGSKKESTSKSNQPNYADRFVSEVFRSQLTEYWLSGWVKDTVAKKIYLEAFRRSDKDAMINYYKANYPTTENLKNEVFLNRPTNYSNLKMPVMIIHGKQDQYLPISGHNNTWDFVDHELTIEVLPQAGHFVQQDESEKVTELIKHFIER